MKMLYFGPEWKQSTMAAPPLCCFWCHEWIASTDSGVIQGLISPDGPACIAYHYECHARSIFGSLGHQQGRCHCFGGTEDDPPELTLREGARAALRYALDQRARGRQVV